MVGKKGQYSIKVCYRLLKGGIASPLLAGLIWNSCIPSKMSVFTWEVWWGKVLTMDQLKKKGFQIASRYPLCQEAEESLDHLLIHCPTTWGLWATLISLLGMVWACPLLAKDLMFEWATFPIKKKARKIWKAAPPSLF